MKKVFIYFVLILAITASISAKSIKSKNSKLEKLPRSHLLTVQNETDHKLFIVEDKSFKKLSPQQAVTLGWKKPLAASTPRSITIYYGGNIKEKDSQLNPKKKRGNNNGKEPILIAQFKTNQPGTVSLHYTRSGILKMERIS